TAGGSRNGQEQDSKRGGGRRPSGGNSFGKSRAPGGGRRPTQGCPTGKPRRQEDRGQEERPEGRKGSGCRSVQNEAQRPQGCPENNEENIEENVEAIPQQMSRPRLAEPSDAGATPCHRERAAKDLVPPRQGGQRSRGNPHIQAA